MADFEEEVSFQCPYCLEEISILVDFCGGQSQSFTVDCEVCCRPIVVRLKIGPEGIVRFEAERES